jgi:DNA-binding PadR family transcriptional regulator
MRTLKYAILGLLNRADMTGYDIAKEFEKTLRQFWYARHSQIYPELAKLIEEGLVTMSAAPGSRAHKKVYSITESGREDFNQWVRLDEAPKPATKDVFRLRVYLSDGMSDEIFLKRLHYQYKKNRALVRDLETSWTGKGYDTADPLALSPAERGDYLVIESALFREKARLKWIKKSIVLLRKAIKMKH